MMQLELSDEQAQLDQAVQRLARTARSTGLDVAAGLLEALREVLSAQHPRPAQGP